MPMRATLTTASVVALLAAGAGTAAAKPDVSSNRADAAAHARGMRALGVHQHQEPAVAFGSSTPVRVDRVAADAGFDWADAGIGAGIAVALLLAGGGTMAVRRPHPITPAR
jgi:hypothetical protein